jgi:hypothetical protein
MVTGGKQRSNQVGDTGAKVIGDALKVNSSLHKLDLVRLCIVVRLCGLCLGVVVLFCFVKVDAWDRAGIKWATQGRRRLGRL